MKKIYKVEKAKKSDLEKIRRILWSSFDKSIPYEKYQLEPWFDDFDHYRSLVIRDGDRIVSHLTIRKYDNLIRGTNIPLAGVSFVATEHLYRNKGMASALMKSAFKDMKQNGEIISILHPFNMAFYERFGYATAETLDRYHIDAENIRDIKLPQGITIREISDLKEATKLDEIQRTMTRYGSMVFFRLCELEDLIKTPNCYIFEKDNKPIGWIKFFIYPSDFVRKQLVINFYAFKNDEALQAIVHLMRIFALEFDIITEFHTTNLPIIWEGIPEVPIREFVKDRFTLKVKRVGGFMIRVIDFVKFCEMITVPKEASQSVKIEIKDKFCKWNNGIWNLEPHKGKLHITETTQNADLSISDLLLSRVVSGLTPAKTLRTVGLIDCSIETAVNLETLFPKESFYVWNRDL